MAAQAAQDFPFAQQQSSTSQQVTELSSRLKVIEDRQLNLRRKSQLTEQNMLNMNKKLAGDLKALSQELHDAKSQLDEISDKLLQLMNELKRTAKKEDVKLLEKYLEFWNPMRFLTREEAIRMIQDSLAQEPEPQP